MIIVIHIHILKKNEIAFRCYNESMGICRASVYFIPLSIIINQFNMYAYEGIGFPFTMQSATL